MYYTVYPYQTTSSYPPLIGGIIAISSPLDSTTVASFSMYVWFIDSMTESLIVCSLNIYTCNVSFEQVTVLRKNAADDV